MKPFNLNEYLANTSRKIVTRDGRSVKIYCTNYCHQYPIIAQIEGEERSHAFCETGHYNIHGESIGDLFFAPEKHEGWTYIAKSCGGRYYLGNTGIYRTKEEAEESGKKCNGYMSTIKIEWEE